MGAFPYDAGYCPEPVSYCTASMSSGGCTAVIGSTGQLFCSGPVDFHVTASGAPNLKPGIMLWGAQTGDIQFGTGTLCITPPIARTPIQFSGGSGAGDDCTGSFDFLLAPSILQGFFIQPGQAVYAQYWFRDPGQAVPNNFGLSDALAIGVCP